MDLVFWVSSNVGCVHRPTGRAEVGQQTWKTPHRARPEHPQAFATRFQKFAKQELRIQFQSRDGQQQFVHKACHFLDQRPKTHSLLQLLIQCQHIHGSLVKVALTNFGSHIYGPQLLESTNLCSPYVDRVP